MTEPAGDALTDPVAAVVAVVTAADPAVDQDTVRAAVERASGGRARRRRLAAAPLCASSTIPDRGFWKACTACGTSGRLLAGICRRCRLRRQLGELLAGPGGQVRLELRPLHDTLASAGRPGTVLICLKRAATRTVLAELATGQRPLSHAALDDLPPRAPDKSRPSSNPPGGGCLELLTK
jgi:hypothetical protein